MTDTRVNTLEKAIFIAHEIKILKSERPKFVAQLTNQQWEEIDWVVDSFPIDPESHAQITTSTWKNNYAKAVETVDAIISLLPRLKEKLQAQRTSTHIESSNFEDISSSVSQQSPKIPKEMPADTGDQDVSSFSAKQRAELVNLVAQGVAAALEPFKLSESSNPQNVSEEKMSQLKLESETNTLTDSRPYYHQKFPIKFQNKDQNYDESRFRAKEIGYFDPDVSKMAVEIRDTHNIYHNVFSFTNRLRIKKGPNSSITMNLDECLLGEANQWYVEELSSITRNGLRYGTIEDWCSTLEKRFSEAPGKALVALEKSRYTVQDVRDGKSPMTYVSNIILHGRSSGITQNTLAQLSLAYEHVDGVLRRDLIRPTATTRLDDFMEQIRDAFNIWVDIYKPRNVYSQNFYSRHTDQSPFAYENNRRNPENFTQQTSKPHDSNLKNQNGSFQLKNSFQSQGNPRKPQNRNFSGYNNDGRYKTFPTKNPGSSEFHRQDPKAYNEHTEEVILQSEQNNLVTTKDQEEHKESELYFEDYDGQYDEDVINNHVNTSCHLNKLGYGRPTTCRKCKQHFKSNNAFHNHWKKCSVKNLTPEPNTEAYTTEISEIIRSKVKTSGPLGYAFRGYKYATTKAKLTENGLVQDICLDTGCTMSLIDEEFLHKQSPQTKVILLSEAIPVSGIGKKTHNCDKYVRLTIFFPGDKKVAAIEAEFHLVRNLTANMLIGIDILSPQGIIMDLKLGIAKITSCDDITISLSTHSKGPRTLSVARSAQNIDIAPGQYTKIQIQPKDLPSNRDLLFEPYAVHHIAIYSHVIDDKTSEIQVYNPTSRLVQMKKGTKLGLITEFEYNGCFLAKSEIEGFAARTPKRGWKNLSLTTPSIYAINSNAIHEVNQTETAYANPSDSNLAEVVLQTGVTICNHNPDLLNKFKDIVMKFPNLWKDTGNVVGIEEDMEIPLVENWEEKYKPGVAKVYPVGNKDQEVIDTTFDKLHSQGRMEWTQNHTPFTYPCFVVWKDTLKGPKGRVVVDIRALNKIALPDAYPIPLQSDIISATRGCSFISTIDCASFFYQWWITKEHRHRLTVSSHRGQETFKVPVMGFRNSPAYVQRRIDILLRKCRPFARAYIDDIVIFSKSPEEHYFHLNHVFTILNSHNITLAPTKSFIAYPSVALLGQKVDALGMATAEDKLKAISSFILPENLRSLERFLGLTGYLRHYIPYYSAIIQPLQDRKTFLSKNLNQKGLRRRKTSEKTLLQKPSSTELKAFKLVQALFKNPSILVHFNPDQQLYVDIDASKEFGFAGVIYHIRENNTVVKPTKCPSEKKMQPILFLSRAATSAERNYWSTELEVACLVWIVRKVRHMIEAAKSPVIIYTDHAATRGIVSQTSLHTSSVEKLNLRLIRASEYLQRFKLDVRHKAGKENIIPDALSRLHVKQQLADQRTQDPNYSELDALDALHGAVDIRTSALWDLGAHVFHITTVQISNELRTQIEMSYVKDNHWAKILQILQKNNSMGENASSLPFELRNNLIYHINKETKTKRLCVPGDQAILKIIFKMAHDDVGHPGIRQTHFRVTQALFINNLSKKIINYIRYCPDCTKNKTLRHKPYGYLQPIESPSKIHDTIGIDFILALPTTKEGKNCVLSVTDKFSKCVTFIPGATTWTAFQWAEVLLNRLSIMNWGLPRAIVSDRDAKFVSQLWRAIFKQQNVKLLFSTSYHPQTDGASERTNATAEISLRFFITGIPQLTDWPMILPKLQLALNNSPKFSTTRIAPTELLHGKKANEPLDLVKLPIDETPHRNVTALTVGLRRSTRLANPEQKVIGSSNSMQNFSTSYDPEDSLISNKDTTQISLVENDKAITSKGDLIYNPNRVEAADAIAFASMSMKKYYDDRHMPMFFNTGDFVMLRLHKGYTIPSAKLITKKLQQQFVGPFRITERIGKLAYRLDIPKNWKIHPVVTIAQLEPTLDPRNDPYNRQIKPDPPIQVDGVLEQEIKKILGKRLIKRRGKDILQYLVTWVGHGPEHDEWIDYKKLKNAQEAVQIYENSLL
ncbi:hypothetical protein K3495_g9197 [Podosphaera aphanis]|nr:hypothetical protein K3495_g9197 [Podosphaera aphanis]